MRSINDAVEVDFFVPPMPNVDNHHVISRGQNPKFYRAEDLKDLGAGKTAWVDAFEKQLTGLYFVLGQPVPYAFRLPDGTVRSLDAGCIKMLLNRNPPDIVLSFGSTGFINSARPSDRLLELYEPLRKRLVDSVAAATELD
jgi:hypothetical protein